MHRGGGYHARNGKKDGSERGGREPALFSSKLRLRDRSRRTQGHRRSPWPEGSKSESPASHRRADPWLAKNGRGRPLLRGHHHPSRFCSGSVARRSAQLDEESSPPLCRQGPPEGKKSRDRNHVRRASRIDLRASAIVLPPQEENIK